MAAIQAYHRPATVEEALALLARPGVMTTLIAGGTRAVATLDENPAVEVVDLQALGLSEIEVEGERTAIGATVTLQMAADDERLPELLRAAAKRAGPNTLRQAATVGGTLAGGDPESELLAVLLVHAAEVELQHGDGIRRLPLRDFLADIPSALAGTLITGVRIATGGRGAAARIGRTPADAPIVAAVVRHAPDGTPWLALCGVAATPVLVDPSAIMADIDPPGDFRGSSAYRREMAQILANRVLEETAQ